MEVYLQWVVLYNKVMVSNLVEFKVVVRLSSLLYREKRHRIYRVKQNGIRKAMWCVWRHRQSRVSVGQHTQCCVRVDGTNNVMCMWATQMKRKV